MQNTIPWPLFMMVVVVCVGLESCSDSDAEVALAEVKGRATLDGEPLPPGPVVTFVSEDGHGGQAEIQEDGAFAVRTEHGWGLPLGKYRVAVFVPVPPEADPFIGGSKFVPSVTIPDKYQDPRTSGIAVDVPAEGSTLNLELVSD